MALRKNLEGRRHDAHKGRVRVDARSGAGLAHGGHCSNLPPYAHAMKEATGLPVFGFITMIDYVHEILSRTRYQGLI